MRSGKRNNKRRKKRILKHSKGFFGTRKNFRLARKGILKTIKNKKISYKLKLRQYKTDNIVFLNSILTKYKISYSKFLSKNSSKLNLTKKVMIDIYKKNEILFEKIINYTLE